MSNAKSRIEPRASELWGDSALNRSFDEVWRQALYEELDRMAERLVRLEFRAGPFEPAEVSEVEAIPVAGRTCVESGTVPAPLSEELCEDFACVRLWICASGNLDNAPYNALGRIKSALLESQRREELQRKRAVVAIDDAATLRVALAKSEERVAHWVDSAYEYNDAASHLRAENERLTAELHDATHCIHGESLKEACPKCRAEEFTAPPAERPIVVGSMWKANETKRVIGRTLRVIEPRDGFAVSAEWSEGGLIHYPTSEHFLSHFTPADPAPDSAKGCEK